MNDTTPQTDENPELESFFSIHGAGDYAVEADMKEMALFIDKSRASLAERAFVRHMVSGKTQVESYLLAFDKEGTISRQTASSNAQNLLKRKRVKEEYWRAMQERDSMADEHLPKLIAELNEDRELARVLGQPSAAIAAVKAKANLLGLENNSPSSVTINLGISEDQREAILERIAKRAQIQNHKNEEIIEGEFTDVDDKQ